MPALVLRRIPISLPSIQLYTFASILFVGLVVMWASNEYERTIFSEEPPDKPTGDSEQWDITHTETVKSSNVTSYAQGM